MKKYKDLNILAVDPISSVEFKKAQDLLCIAADMYECGAIECEDCLYNNAHLGIFTKWVKKKTR